MFRQLRYARLPLYFIPLFRMDQEAESSLDILETYPLPGGGMTVAVLNDAAQDGNETFIGIVSRSPVDDSIQSIVVCDCCVDVLAKTLKQAAKDAKRLKQKKT